MADGGQGRQQDGPLDRVLGNPLGMLESWAPVDPASGFPTWGAILGVVDYDPEDDRPPWPAEPTLADATRYGGFNNSRFPVSVEVLNRYLTDGPRRGRGARPGKEVAARVANLLTARLGKVEGFPDLRTQLVINHLASELGRWCPDVLHLTVAATPDGPPLDEVHLLARGVYGDVVCLTLQPAAAQDVQASAIAAYLRHFPTDEADDLTFAHRSTELEVMLGDLLSLEFSTRVDPHHLPLDMTDLDAADNVVRAWPPATDSREEQFDWPSWWRRFGHTLTRLSADTLADVRTDLERQVHQRAVVAWAGDDSEQDEAPRDPALVTWLVRDFVDIVLARVAEPTPTDPVLAYAGGLPFTEGINRSGCLLLIGPTRAGLIVVKPDDR